MFRTVFWVIALIIVILAGYRLAADQREHLSAIDLLPEGGRFTETAHGRIHSIEFGPEGCIMSYMRSYVTLVGSTTVYVQTDIKLSATKKTNTYISLSFR